MKKEPVAIGYLERFAADTDRLSGKTAAKKAESNGIKVAVAGSGPAGCRLRATWLREVLKSPFSRRCMK